MKKYLITLNGCHEITECKIELTKEELEIFMHIAEEINKNSTSSCEPDISIYEIYEREPEYIDLLKNYD